MSSSSNRKDNPMKHQQKPEATDFPCFECEQGTMRLVYEDFKTETSDLGAVTVPKVPMHRCDRCDACAVGDEGGEVIDAYLDKLSGAITPKEIQALLDKYKITQKQAAEITGYGEKNISRWLRGHMRPSKSVSNHLRTLLASAEAFEILRNRSWNHRDEAKLIPKTELIKSVQEFRKDPVKWSVHASSQTNLC